MTERAMLSPLPLHVMSDERRAVYLPATTQCLLPSPRHRFCQTKDTAEPLTTMEITAE